MKPHKDGGQIWGGNRKRTAAIQERKNVRGHGDNKTRNILKDKQTEEEAVEVQRPRSKLEREYSGKNSEIAAISIGLSSSRFPCNCDQSTHYRTSLSLSKRCIPRTGRFVRAFNIIPQSEARI